MTADETQVAAAAAALAEGATASMATYSVAPGVGEPVSLPYVVGPLGAPQGLNYGPTATEDNHGAASPPR